MRDLFLYLQSLEPERLHKLRDELEMRIGSVEGELRTLAWLSYAVAILGGVLAIAARDLTSLFAPLMIIGFAYSVRTMQSRKFAVASIVFAICVLFDVPRMFIPGAPADSQSLAFAVAALVASLQMARSVWKLAPLRAIQSLIPAERVVER